MANVNAATGEMCHSDTDFVLPALIPIEFARGYRTSSQYNGPIGFGWAHSLDMHLREMGDHIIFHNEVGLDVQFDSINPGEASFQALDTLSAMQLTRRSQEFVLSMPDRKLLTFTKVKTLHNLYNLRRIEDLNGNAIELEYDDNRLFHIKDSFNRHLLFYYYTNGKLKEIYLVTNLSTRETQRLASYEYDSLGDLIMATDSLNNTWLYEYKHHLLVKFVNRLDGSCYFEYDAHGRCLKVWRESRIKLRSFNYDPIRRITVVTDSLGHRTIYKFNTVNLLVEEINPLGYSKTTVYDGNNNLVLSSDELGSASGTFDIYDSRKRELKKITAEGAITTLVYNTLNQITSLTNAERNTWEAQYDGRGNLKEIRLPLGGLWKYDYDSKGFLTKLTAPNGHTLSIARGQDGLTSKFEDNLGELSHFSYDIFGRLVETIDPLGNRTRLIYDVLGRLIALEQPDQTITQYEYNAEGDLLRYIDENGNITSYEFDAYSICIAKIDALGQRINYEYDTELNLIGIINQKGERSTFMYDALNRLIQQTLFDGRSYRYAYNPRGDLTSVMDVRSGASASIEYNSSSQVTKVDFGGGHAADYEYDLLRRLRSSTLGGNTVSWKFNAEGNLIREECDGYVAEYAFDGMGNRTEVHDSRGITLRYQYDLRNRLIALFFQGWHRFEYDELDRLTQHEMPNGCIEVLTYDLGSRIESKRVLTSLGREILGRRYIYDKRGLLSRVQNVGGKNKSYDYDEIRRLRRVIEQEVIAEEYNYDACDNIVSSPTFSDMHYEEGNRIAQAAATKYRYDSYGNLIAKLEQGRETVYQYGMGVLQRIIHPDAGIVDYQYDPLGRRTVKWCGAHETRFFWDLHALLGEEERHNGETTEVTDYIFLPNSFIPLELRREKRSYFYVVDHLGTPTELLDENGEIAWAADLTAWGELKTVYADRVSNPLRFQGQYCEETALHYSRYRYYDPQIGRYTSPDPLGLAGGLNLYRYAPDPINWIDPLGLAAIAMPPNVVQYNVTPCTPNPNPNNCPPANPPATSTPNPAQGCFTAAGGLRGGGRPANGPHNQTIQQIDQLNGLNQTGGNFRVNQQQVNAGGVRVGRNRPDIQVTINGQRNYVEVDRAPASRADCHRYQICNNDPEGVVHLAIIP